MIVSTRAGAWYARGTSTLDFSARSHVPVLGTRMKLLQRLNGTSSIHAVMERASCSVGAAWSLPPAGGRQSDGLRDKKVRT